ncbi:MAG TPA: hypothetical protein VIR62_06395 [Allosphingosinicella sp.]
MTTMTIGSNRPKLSLAFAGPLASLRTGTNRSRPAFEPFGKLRTGGPLPRDRSPTLPGTLSRRELRRIVTELLG